MVLHIHSLGSLWQFRDRPTGPAIWNTTGVIVRDRLRSRATTYGQVSLAPLARSAFARLGPSLSGRWQADLSSHGGGRLVRLVRPAPRNAVPERSLVCVTSKMIGQFTATDTEQQSSELVCVSSYKDSVEALILMSAYAWVRGSRGSITLLPHGSSFKLRLIRWE